MAAGAQTLMPIRGPRRGFSFLKEVQPILDRNCVKCHDERHPKKMDLRNTAVPDPGAKRKWTQAYLTLTHAGPDRKEEGSCWRGQATHPMLNWISAASAPTLQKPYSAGSNASDLFKKLDGGHCKTLTQEELASLATWVDLGVPFCENYCEANMWNESDVRKYQQYQAKRDRMAAEDLRTLRMLSGK